MRLGSESRNASGMSMAGLFEELCVKNFSN